MGRTEGDAQRLHQRASICIVRLHFLQIDDSFLDSRNIFEDVRLAFPMEGGKEEGGRVTGEVKARVTFTRNR